MSGLADYVPLEELQGRLVVMMCNLKPVKMRGELTTVDIAVENIDGISNV